MQKSQLILHQTNSKQRPFFQSLLWKSAIITCVLEDTQGKVEEWEGLQVDYNWRLLA